MEKGFESVPTVNMNIIIQNYINLNGFEGKNVDPMFFSKEQAKPATTKLRRVETSRQLESFIKPSSQSALPNLSIEKRPVVEEPVAKQIISRRKQSEIYETRKEAFEDKHMAQIFGVLLITFAAALFIGVFYSIIISPLVGATSHVLLDFILNDIYYCCLFPLMIPASLVFIYANWVSVKFFRHS